MNNKTNNENSLLLNKHILLYVEEQTKKLELHNNSEFEYITKNFCGIIMNSVEAFNDHTIEPNTLVYLCGDIEENLNKMKLRYSISIFAIGELSTNFEYTSKRYQVITTGGIPLNVYGVGILFRNFFAYDKNYFNCIQDEHKFQSLTESNKPGNAFRTGIYLTNVKKQDNETKFKLLRCSSNLNGPTDNFRATDMEIINQVNNVCEYFFKEKSKLNHVLAQIYENKTVVNNDKIKEKKATIKRHSDKTKDMPQNGLMAFCTFYKDYINGKFHGDELKHITKSSTDPFDYCYNNVSVLTKLRFELKSMVNDKSLIKKFDIPLYPNSVFIMPLSTNRIYTHEIRPSGLSIQNLPTRLGYVIRCSKTDAVYKNGNTYIIDKDGSYIKMEQPDHEGIQRLKGLYYKENVTDELINYDKFYFSLNSGDYLEPIV